MQLQSDGVEPDCSAILIETTLNSGERAHNTLRARAIDANDPWNWISQFQGSLLIFNSRTEHCWSCQDNHAMMTKEIDAEYAYTRHASRWTQSGLTDSERAYNGEALNGPFRLDGRTQPGRGGVWHVALPTTPPNKSPVFHAIQTVASFSKFSMTGIHPI